MADGGRENLRLFFVIPAKAGIYAIRFQQPGATWHDGLKTGLFPG
jgi:hypothetical protein